MSAQPPEDRSIRAWTLLALLVGCVLRLARPDVHSFWIDEGMTLQIAESADPFAYFAFDSHPPLAFLAVRVWSRIFGTSDVALRLLPALVSCASLGLFVPLARAWFGRQRATWAIAIYAVAPLLVWYAHEVRMYAFVELTTLAILVAARWAWAAPSILRWSVLSGVTALATGSHYYGALAGLTVVAQSLGDPARASVRTALATGLGVLVWTPWLVEFLPHQRDGTWPLIVQMSPRDFAEVPVRLVAVDLIVLVEHGLAFVGWILGGLCLLAFVVGSARGFVRRARPELDAVLAALVPIAAAGLLAQCAGGGFQARYLTPAIPGAIATIALGLLVPRPAILGRIACAILLACALTITVLQLAENRREDYRAATAEIRDRWREGDRLLVLVCVPEVYVSATVDHYLRDRPDILRSRLDAEDYLAGKNRPSSGTRVHVIWREATVCWEPMARLAATHTFVESSAPRFRIHRRLTTVP